MKFLFDENMPRLSASFLQSEGYDVEIITGTLMGSPDAEIIDFAVANEQIIVTFDSDFGELIYRFDYRPKGIIYFRWESFRPAEPREFIHGLVQKSTIVLEDYFTVIDRGAIRQRRI